MSAALEAREPDARYLTAVQPALVRQFELLATAPGGVARLRDLILSLAVQGKLVPQVPSDEPVTELLREINAEKSLLTTSGRIQRPRPSPEVQVHEEPFELPLGWAWARLPQISYDLGQGAPTQAFTYIDVAAIDNKRAVVTDAVEVVQAADAPSRARKRVSVGSVIYSTVRPYLKNIAIVEKVYTPSAIVSTAFAVMHPHTGVSAKYLLHYLRSAVFTQFVASKMAGIAYPAINDSSFFCGIVALPPTAEQERIVARVDELMRLCDALEAKGRLEAEQHARLLGTLLGTLTDSTTPEELAANWQRVADHFDLLLDRPEAVDALEQTILQLAVRGLLVPQDEADEPAHAVLERINSQRRRARKQSSATPLESDPAEPPYVLPSQWAWARLADLVENMGSGWSPACEDGERTDPARWAVLRTTSVQVMEYRAHEHKAIPLKLAPRPEIEVKPGDILVTRAGPMNRVGISCWVDQTPARLMLSDKIVRFHPVTDDLSPAFVVLALNAGWTRELLEAAKTGMAASQVNVSQSDLKSLWIPVCSQEEQDRILARVTELRRLCAALRQRLATSQTTQSQLAEALVDFAAA